MIIRQRIPIDMDDVLVGMIKHQCEREIYVCTK